MTGRKFYLTAAAITAVTAAVIFAAVYAYFYPNIGSRLVRGERFLARGAGEAAAAEFYAVLELTDLSNPAEMKHEPEKYAPAYSAALGYADAKVIAGETEEAKAFLRAFAPFGAEAAAQLEALEERTQPVPVITEPENHTVVWQNTLFEKIIREALSLPDGDVTVRDLDAIYDICIFGSRYTGINMLSRGSTSDFTNLLDLYESERDLYEGYELNGLPDLINFKNLSYVLLYDCGINAALPEDLPIKFAVIGR